MATYSTTEQVKVKLVKVIDTTDATEDAIIASLRARYYAHINSQLRPYICVPLTAASEDYNLITEIEALYSAGAWLMEREDVIGSPNENKGRIYKDEADKLLQSYIDSHFLNGTDILYHYRSGNSWEASDIDDQ